MSRAYLDEIMIEVRECQKLLQDAISNQRDNVSLLSNRFIALKTQYAQHYCSKLQDNLLNKTQVFFADFKLGVFKQDLDYLNVLIDAHTICQVETTNSERIMIVQDLMSLTKSGSDSWNHYIAILIERMCDLINEEDDRLIYIVKEIIADKKSSLWYQVFKGSFVKLLYNLPINKKAYDMLKANIEHNYEDIKEEIKAWIDYKYIEEQGLVDEKYEWVEKV